MDLHGLLRVSVVRHRRSYLAPPHECNHAGWLVTSRGCGNVYISNYLEKQTSSIVSFEIIQSVRTLAQLTSPRSLVRALYLGQSNPKWTYTI